MVVYADILFCLNLLVNYFLLLATGRFCQRKQIRWRLVLAAALGAAYAMILFVRGLPPWVLLASKLLVSAAMVRVAYRCIGPMQFAKEYLVFFTVNFIFAGLMLALWLFCAPTGMVFSNGVVYFNISAVMLVGFTAVAYALAELFSRLYRKQGVDTAMYTVTVELNQKQALLTGFFDTGNTLKEAYSGYPVAVCSYEALRGILPDCLASIFCGQMDDLERLERLVTANIGKKFKLIPYTTVGFSGILPAFQPDRMVLQKGPYNFEIENIYIAISQQRLSGGNYDMLLGAEMLPMEYRAQKEKTAQAK